MNIVLWVLQGALALKFVSVAYTHGLRPRWDQMRSETPRFGAATRPLLVLIALAVFLGAVCLIAPGLTNGWTWLTPGAAAVLAGMMLLAVGFHLACRARPNIWAALILCVMATFVAYGRWVLAPL
jgi:divalent metal cation (Fe/Co/Zn/Cd) transporter